MNEYFLDIIIATLVLICMVVPLWKDYQDGHYSKKLSKRFKWQFYLMSLAGLLTLFFTIFKSKLAKNEKLELIEKNRIDSLEARNWYIKDSTGHIFTIQELTNQRKMDSLKIIEDSVRYDVTLSNFAKQLSLQGLSLQRQNKTLENQTKTIVEVEDMLKYINNEDSLITIHPIRKGNKVEFYAVNEGNYAVNFIVINFSNQPFADSVLNSNPPRDATGNITLNDNESDLWRKQVKISLDGRRREKFCEFNITRENAVLNYAFDVSWNNKRVRYRFELLFPSNVAYWNEISTRHFDVNKKKFFKVTGYGIEYQ